MSALLLAPHNDDETLFATFSCLRFQPHIIICLRSFRMADPSYPGGMPVDHFTRELETARAMEFLGCSWEQWPYRDDAEDVYPLLAVPLSELARETHFDLVLAPAVEHEGHPHHNTVGSLATGIWGERVTSYLTYTAHGGKSRDGSPVEYEPEWVALKHSALACYQSQSAHPATRAHFMADLEEYVAA